MVNNDPRRLQFFVDFNVAFTDLSLLLCLELKEPVGQIVCTDKGILAVEQNKVLVPPTWSKTFAWGYADLSCRLANYDSDKVVSLELYCDSSTSVNVVTF